MGFIRWVGVNLSEQPRAMFGTPSGDEAHLTFN
jgi:hypothetical protein